MPSAFPNSPKLVKGAFIEYKSEFLGPIPNIIVFQYNPTDLSRDMTLQRITPKGIGSKTVAKETDKTARPPGESISLNIILDATDQLEYGNPIAMAKGISPTLAALELLIYPESPQTLGAISSLLSSDLEEGDSVPPLKLPIVLFFWGLSRILPVKIRSLSINETAFDSMLNPIRAEVRVSLDVLTKKDLEEDKIAQWAYTWTQKQKEITARLNLITSAEIIAGQFF